MEWRWNRELNGKVQGLCPFDPSAAFLSCLVASPQAREAFVMRREDSLWVPA